MAGGYWFLCQAGLLPILMSALVMGCAMTEHYGPALPLPQWDNTPLVPNTAPPPELQYQEPPSTQIPPGLVPSPEEWQAFRPAPKAVQRCVGKGTRRRCRAVTPASVVEQAKAATLIRPKLEHMAGLNSAMVQYPVDVNPAYKKIYEILCAVTSPCYLLLPAGEHLTAPLLLDQDPEHPVSWEVAYPKMGQGETRQEVIALRPRSAPQTVFNSLLFQSGLILFVKLVAVTDGGMLSVTWDVPRTPKPAVMLAADRPPVLNYSRLFSSYTVEVKGPTTPPWLPVSVLDDGSKTLIKFAEPLTYTRGPAVFGVTQQGGSTLVQSHMYVPPSGSGIQGAWMVVQGLFPALLLKDSAGLEVRIVRGDVRAPVLTGVRHGY